MIAPNQDEQPESFGGSGGPCVLPRGRADTALIERAIREQWPIADEYRKPLVDRQVRIALDPTIGERESTSAFRSLLFANQQNLDVAMKALDKIAPDQHQLTIGLESRVAVKTLFNEPEYVEFLRYRTVNEDCDARAVCQIRESGNGQAVENGPPHGGPGSGADGDRNGSE